VIDPDEPSPELWALFNTWLEESKANKQDEDTIPGFNPRRTRTARRPHLVVARPQGELAGLFHECFGCGASMAEQFARAWAAHMFSAADVREWIAAGLQPQDVEEAATYRAAGLQPAHLSIVIRSDSIRSRLQGGHFSVRQVVELLRREGRLELSA